MRKIIIDESQSSTLKNILTETPDIVYDMSDWPIATAYERDSLAFGFYRDVAFVGYNEALIFDNKNIKNDVVHDFLLNTHSRRRVTHLGIQDFYKYLDLGDSALPYDTGRDSFDFPGRLWYDAKIISFWKYPEPNKLNGLLRLLSAEIYRVYNYKIDFSEYKIEVDTMENLIPISKFIGAKDVSKDVMDMPHMLPAEDKKKSQQMSDYLNSKYSKYKDKFKNTSQAQWNSAKKKSIGESFLQVNEIKSSEVNLSSFVTKDELNQKIWNGFKLNYKVRRKLLNISDDFIDFCELKNVKVKDILFLGSMANYNWSKHSDIDLHLIVDFSAINKDKKFVKSYFDAKRKLWNSEHESLKIYGFQVEVYVEDVDEKNSSESSFSLEKNRWLVKPVKAKVRNIDSVKVKNKAADIMTRIDDLCDLYKSDSSKKELESLSNKVKTLFDKVRLIRKDGLDSDMGEFSVGNIVFKVLRRSGYIEKLVDLKIDTYDKINTLK